MGNRSPGKIKREGRKAYANGCDATDNPYIHQTWSGNAEYWYEGWLEEQAHELETEEKEFELKTRTTYEIPLSEFETLGSLIDALERYTMAKLTKR